MIEDIHLKADILNHNNIPEEELDKFYAWLKECPWHYEFEGAVDKVIHLSFISKEIVNCPKCEDTGTFTAIVNKANYYGPNEGEVFEEELECDECDIRPALPLFDQVEWIKKKRKNK